MKKQKRIVPILTAAVTLGMLLWFLGATRQLDADRSREGRQQLEDSLRRAAVACYAAEGVYPPTLDYLTAHYGVQLDTDRYQVFYEVFGENLMPQITVLEKNDEK